MCGSIASRLTSLMYGISYLLSLGKHSFQCETPCDYRVTQQVLDGVGFGFVVCCASQSTELGVTGELVPEAGNRALHPVATVALAVVGSLTKQGLGGLGDACLHHRLEGSHPFLRRSPFESPLFKETHHSGNVDEEVEGLFDHLLQALRPLTLGGFFQTGADALKNVVMIEQLQEQALLIVMTIGRQEGGQSVGIRNGVNGKAPDYRMA